VSPAPQAGSGPGRRRSAGRVLPRRFYALDARELAPQLLNKLIVRNDEERGERLVARVVEVEAYAGAEDAGSHSFRGMTRRNATMFGPPGHLYVYFTYGMHWCMNVVAGGELAATAVLLRAAVPLRGIHTMRRRRPGARTDRDLCSGPARLAQAFGVDGSFDGTDLVRGAVRILDDGTPPPLDPAVTTRVGLSPGRGEHHLWRYFVAGEPGVSRGPRVSPAVP
jgi:DNA-3-methyladenine glycosylase